MANRRWSTTSIWLKRIVAGSAKPPPRPRKRWTWTRAPNASRIPRGAQQKCLNLLGGVSTLALGLLKQRDYAQRQ
eukprot:7852421-Pyramimonas_sp.AAC.1